MTASVLPELLDLLNTYLTGRVAAWLDQPTGDRTPTLPMTVDGKVNVLALAEESGIGAARQQHLFKRLELKSLVNAVAFEQGLKPIGGRMPSDDLDREAAAHVRRTEARSNDLTKQVAEQGSVIDRQRREIEGLREQLRMFEETGQVLRTAPVRL